MEKLSNSASIVTVVALLLMIQYSSEPSDSWDAVLAIIAGIVFWTTRNEWFKDKLISSIISVGIGTSVAILISVIKQAYEIYETYGPYGLTVPHEPLQKSPFIDSDFMIALTIAVAFYSLNRWKNKKLTN